MAYGSGCKIVKHTSNCVKTFDLQYNPKNYKAADHFSQMIDAEWCLLLLFNKSYCYCLDISLVFQ